jgi:hypothetical protein
MLMREKSAKTVPSLALLIGLGIVLSGSSSRSHAAENDLDTFMRQVIVKRDDNWKKLQQYVLDERETIDLRGPGRIPLWGDKRDYTWYIRDGFFVRSPVKVNGVAIGETDRRKAEAEYLKRAKARDQRNPPGASDRLDPPGQGDAAPSVDGLLKQTRQPGFISSAYFLRFKFEEGKYALVGHETLDGRDVLRVEYYPTKLFGGTDRRRNQDGKATDRDRAYDAEFQRMMNKVALVTLWVEPQAQQIVKYTFQNLPFDFLPAQWLVHVDDLRASMTMSQPFPGVWLPRDLEFLFNMTLALGQVEMRYGLEYHDYRRAEVGATITIK